MPGKDLVSGKDFVSGKDMMKAWKTYENHGRSIKNNHIGKKVRGFRI